MGIVSPDDFDKELKNSTPKPVATVPSSTPIDAEIVDMPVPGRKEGDVNVPDSLRQIIGATSFENGRSDAIELGKQFGISPSAVSAYAHGSTSTASYDKTPNTSIIAKSRIRVQKRAMNRLMGALEHLTPEKLGEAKARDLAGIAKDMSAVVKSLEPENPDNGKDKAPVPQFVVYAPQFKDERSYEVIYAKE